MVGRARECVVLRCGSGAVCGDNGVAGKQSAW